jgi:hypothetical protein
VTPREHRHLWSVPPPSDTDEGPEPPKPDEGPEPPDEELHVLLW